METIHQVSLEQLIDEIKNYKRQVDAGKISIHFMNMEPIDMLYLTRNHSQKENISIELISFIEQSISAEEIDRLHHLHRYWNIPAKDEYDARRKLCLAIFYIERNVLTDFWCKTCQNMAKYLTTN